MNAAACRSLKSCWSTIPFLKCGNRYAEALTITKIRSFKHEPFFFGGGGGGGAYSWYFTVLIPKWSYLPSFCKKERVFKRKQASGYDHRHRTYLQSTLEDEEDVWVTTGDEMVKGQIRGQANTPRSYYVDIPPGQVKRNRSHLKPIPREQEKEEDDDNDGNTE